MTQKVEDEPTTYEYEAPTSRVLDGDLEEQDWRDQVFGASVGALVIAIAVFALSDRGVLAAVFAAIGGICLGYGWAKYRVMKPDGGLVGQLRGGRQ